MQKVNENKQIDERDQKEQKTFGARYLLQYLRQIMRY